MISDVVPREQRDWDWAGNSRRRRPLVAAVLAAGRTCHLCGLPGATTADHIIPWSHGGPNTLDNLAPAHYSCNSARGSRTLEEWFTYRPMTGAALAPSREW